MTPVVDENIMLARIRALAWAPLWLSLLYLAYGILRTRIAGSSCSVLSARIAWLNHTYFFISGALFYMRQEIFQLTDDDDVQILDDETNDYLSEERNNMLKSRSILYVLWAPATFGVLLGLSNALVGLMEIRIGEDMNTTTLSIILFSYPVAFLLYGSVIHLMLDEIRRIKKGKGSLIRGSGSS